SASSSSAASSSFSPSPRILPAPRGACLATWGAVADSRKERLRREQQKLLDDSAVVAYKDYPDMRSHFRKILTLTEMSPNEFSLERGAIGNLGKPLTPQQEKLAAAQDSGRPRRTTHDGGAEA
ncbi:unnamed protein product, partial [Prorocentrum cordatum]